MQTPNKDPVPARSGLMKVIPFWEFRHPGAWARWGGVAAFWLLSLGIILCSVGYWWGAVLFAPAAARLWVSYQLVSFTRAHPAGSRG